jgi:hypothetical protein
MTCPMCRLDDPVYALMNPLMMVVLKIFCEYIMQLLFGREDEVVETFFFDGSDKPFCVSIEIGTSWW